MDRQRYGTRWVFKDGHATPKKSPQDYTSATLTLTPTVRCVGFYLNATTDIRVADTPDFSQGYRRLKAGNDYYIPWTDRSPLYITRNTTDGVLDFSINEM